MAAFFFFPDSEPFHQFISGYGCFEHFYNEIMNTNSKLNSDLLTACGTCDFLSSLLGWDMRTKLADSLLEFVRRGTQSDAQAKKLVELLPDILTPSSDRTFSGVPLPVDAYDPSVTMLEDFQWADDYFKVVSPDFPALNEPLLKSIYWRLACLFGFEDQPWAQPFFPAPELRPLDDDFSKEHSDPETENDSDQAASTASVQKQEAKAETDGLTEEQKPVSQLEVLLGELDSLTGLDAVKAEVRDLCALLEISRLRQSRGLKGLPAARHLVFSGNPGTGKTTTARILAKIYRELGFLSKGGFVECSRADLVGEYIGTTAQKTRAVIKKALGGVLFIDEAYSLTRSSEKDFGHEAVEVLLQEMENNRDDLVVIAAGYPHEMEKFLLSNPGLRSRFTTFLHFENYSAIQLAQITCAMARHLDYKIDDEACEKLVSKYEDLLASPPAGFANAREARTILEKAISRQARRLIGNRIPDDDELITLKSEDFD